MKRTERSSSTKSPQAKLKIRKESIRDLEARGRSSKVKGGAYTIGRDCLKGDGA